jgi:hypothetical protein
MKAGMKLDWLWLVFGIALVLGGLWFEADWHFTPPSLSVVPRCGR